MAKKFDYDLSVVFPTLNEGDKPRKVLDELYEQFERLNLNAEIIAIDVPSDNPSYQLTKEYADKYNNFTAIKLSHKMKAGSSKTIKYMIGFELAKGKYIVQIDSDGQDNPADLEKFIEKLDEGYDAVTGFKQNRKDSGFYMLQSKIGNFFTRLITKTNVHDMNCGFKAYQSHVAKGLNLRGRWYRYIPSILTAKGYKITEVPIENRKREWGKSNFSFFNRLQGGLFDMLTIAIINNHRDVPMYFWGWLGIILSGMGFVSFVLGLFLKGDVVKMSLIGGSFLMFNMAFMSFVTGLMNEFRRDSEKPKLTDYPIEEIYRNTSIIDIIKQKFQK